MNETARTDREFMHEALALARMGWGLTSPNPMVGAVIVRDGEIIGRGYHCKAGEPHAEINALRDVAKHGIDPAGSTMYVTLEPCQMCAGALVQSRIDEVVIGSMNPKAGCAGSVLNLLEVEGFNHKVKITRGVLEEECSTMLSDFFKELREKKKRLKMLAKQQAQEAVDGDR